MYEILTTFLVFAHLPDVIAWAQPPLAAPYASWAHSHFVWVDASQSNQANVSNLVAGYKAHNITVGAVDIDSGWSTGFNNFVPDESKFPDLVRLLN